MKREWEEGREGGREEGREGGREEDNGRRNERESRDNVTHILVF